MKNSNFVTEFPGGIPTVSGHFGAVTHQPGAPVLHLLLKDWDLLFVKKGPALFKLKSNRVVEVPEGHFLFLPPYVSLWLQTHKWILQLNFLHFSFYPMPLGVFPGIYDDCLVTKKKVLIPLVFSAKKAPKVWLAYRDLLAVNLSEEGPPWRFACALNRLVSELGAFAIGLNLTTGQTLADSAEAMDPRVAELCKKISEKPAVPWKISELAKSVGLSVGHLNQLWYANLGMNIKRYAIEMRLLRASQLLLDPSRKSPRSIKEVGFLCGFTTQQFFSQQFKKFFRTSPSQYRHEFHKTPIGSPSWLVNPGLRLKKKK
jgi:AraC-like DNA-binding protein